MNNENCEPSNPWNDLAYLVRLKKEGERLTSTESVQLENMLLENELDVSCRVKLIAFYLHNVPEHSEGKLYSLVLWLVENLPRVKFHQYYIWPWNQPFTNELKEAWLSMTEQFPTDTCVLDNAAHLVKSVDKECAAELWLQAQRLEPNNDKWPMLLSHIYSCCISSSTGPERETIIDKTIDFGKLAFALHQNSNHKPCYLYRYGKMTLNKLIVVARQNSREEDADQLEQTRKTLFHE